MMSEKNSGRRLAIAGAALAITLAIGGGIALGGSEEQAAQPAGSSITASSTTSSSTTASSQVTTSQATSAPQRAITKPAPTGPVLDHFGYGELKLGMTFDQAVASGEITPNHDPAGPDAACTTHHFIQAAYDSPVYISKNVGVATIVLPPHARTTEGIGNGSTLAEAQAVYPALEKGPNAYSVRLADNAVAFYLILFDEAGKVESLSLNRVGQDCHS